MDISHYVLFLSFSCSRANKIKFGCIYRNDDDDDVDDDDDLAGSSRRKRIAQKFVGCLKIYHHDILSVSILHFMLSALNNQIFLES